MILELGEYIVDLLAALVHLRIFTMLFSKACPIKDVHQFITKVSDRAPHLEYVSLPCLKYYYKRDGGELVICEPTEFTFVRLNSLHVRMLIITVIEVVTDPWEVGYLHRGDCAVAEREGIGRS